MVLVLVGGREVEGEVVYCIGAVLCTELCLLPRWRLRLGASATLSPIMKNVALTHSAASASRTLLLLPWIGPSSNVRTTSRFFRRSDSGYCSVPMRGKSDVLTVMVRLVPRTSGLLLQLGPANAAPTNMPLATTATLTSFEIRTNFNMSFCSGLPKEPQCTSLSENGMEMLVLTLPRCGRSHALDKIETKKVNAAPAAL